MMIITTTTMEVDRETLIIRTMAKEVEEKHLLEMEEGEEEEWDKDLESETSTTEEVVVVSMVEMEEAIMEEEETISMKIKEASKKEEMMTKEDLHQEEDSMEGEVSMEEEVIKEEEDSKEEIGNSTIMAVALRIMQTKEKDMDKEILGTEIISRTEKEAEAKDHSTMIFTMKEAMDLEVEEASNRMVTIIILLECKLTMHITMEEEEEEEEVSEDNRMREETSMEETTIRAKEEEEAPSMDNHLPIMEDTITIRDKMTSTTDKEDSTMVVSTMEVSIKVENKAEEEEQLTTISMEILKEDIMMITLVATNSKETTTSIKGSRTTMMEAMEEILEVQVEEEEECMEINRESKVLIKEESTMELKTKIGQLLLTET
jgi:hypothetical protein